MNNNNSIKIGFVLESYFFKRKCREDDIPAIRSLIQNEANFFKNMANVPYSGISLDMAKFHTDSYMGESVKTTPDKGAIIRYIVDNYQRYIKFINNKDVIDVINDSVFSDEEKTELIEDICGGYDPRICYKNIGRFLQKDVPILKILKNMGVDIVIFYSYILDYIYGIDIIVMPYDGLGFKCLNIKTIDDEGHHGSDKLVFIRNEKRVYHNKLFYPGVKIEKLRTYDPKTDSIDIDEAKELVKSQLRISYRFFKALCEISVLENKEDYLNLLYIASINNFGCILSNDDYSVFEKTEYLYKMFNKNFELNSNYIKLKGIYYKRIKEFLTF